MFVNVNERSRPSAKKPPQGWLRTRAPGSLRGRIHRACARQRALPSASAAATRGRSRFLRYLNPDTWLVPCRSSFLLTTWPSMLSQTFQRDRQPTNRIRTSTPVSAQSLPFVLAVWCARSRAQVLPSEQSDPAMKPSNSPYAPEYLPDNMEDSKRDDQLVATAAEDTANCWAARIQRAAPPRRRRRNSPSGAPDTGAHADLQDSAGFH